MYLWLTRFMLFELNQNRFSFTSGLFTVVVYCLLTALPHFLYGPGEDALLLTTEYAEQYESLRKMDTIDWGKNLCKPIGKFYVFQLLDFIS